MAASNAVVSQVNIDPGIRFPVIKRVQTNTTIDDVGFRPTSQGVISSLATQSVNTFPATQSVITTTADKSVCAESAGKFIHTAITCQHVIKGRSPNILNIGDDIASGMAANSSPIGQVYPDAGIGTAVVQGVNAVIPVDNVCARSPPDQVVAGVAYQRVGVRTAVQVVTDINPPVGQQYDHHRQGKTQDQQVGYGNQGFHQLCPSLRVTGIPGTITI